MLNKDSFTFYTAFVDAECRICKKEMRIPIKVCFEHKIIENPAYKCFCEIGKNLVDKLYKQRDELETEEFKAN
jgi:hypothetical protein